VVWLIYRRPIHRERDLEVGDGRLDKVCTGIFRIYQESVPGSRKLDSTDGTCSADNQRPSVLAKIYGFFKIGYRNAVTGRSMRMNVLIMENLFYDRRFSKVSILIEELSMWADQQDIRS
jgi:hypothetical protein